MISAMLLLSAALAAEPVQLASAISGAALASATTFVDVASFTDAKGAASKLQCRAVNKVVECQAVVGKAVTPVAVTAVRSREGSISLAPDSMTIVVDFASLPTGLDSLRAPGAPEPVPGKP